MIPLQSTSQHPHQKNFSYFIWGGLFMVTAVILGAFGAHGLKKIVSPEKLITFETGVRYQIYHSLALLFLGLFQHLFQHLSLKKTAICFITGIFIFSFNCYIYVISNVKFFAMIVPVGGVLFIVGWIFFLVSLRSVNNSI